MGIKDKVLDILFDDENDSQDNIEHQEHNKQISEKPENNPIHDTGSIFIDATSPLPVSSPNPRKQNDEDNHNESKSDGEPAYQMSENISPIFGPLGTKNKKKKDLSKIKNINELTNQKLDLNSKTQQYTKVVISPIYGPITTKTFKKNKTRKKEQDPFDRDINDTGSFDTVLSEDDGLDQQFENADEQTEATQKDTLGDTDRLDRISDRINRIKNEAANLYHNGDVDDEIVAEDGYDVETIEYSSISEVIHDVQNHDEKMEHPQIRHAQTDKEEEKTGESDLEFAKSDPFIEVKQDNQPPVIKPAVIPVEEPSAEPVEEKEELVNENIIEPIVEEPQTEPVETNEPGKEEISNDFSQELEQFNDFELNVPENKPNIIGTPNAQLSEDDIFKDEDTDEGKDLFSVLFGDD